MAGDCSNIKEFQHLCLLLSLPFWIPCGWGITWLLRLISYPVKRSKVLMNQWSSVNLFILSEKARVSSYIYIYIFHFYLFIIFFVCAGSSLLHGLFLQLRWVGLLCICGRQGSHCSGFSCCRAPALARMGFSRCGTWALERNMGCGSQALECRLRSCDPWA